MIETIAFPFIVLFAISLIGFGILRRHLKDQNRLRLREILHEERMKAMEKGVATPEIDAELSRALAPVQGTDSSAEQSVLWLRLLALCFGLLLTFTGLGMAVGMASVSDPELTKLSEIGFIPAFAGVGLLLFYVLTRRPRRSAGD